MLSSTPTVPHSSLPSVDAINTRVRAAVPRESWEAALETCRRAAGLFPRCHHVGIDLLFTPSFRRHALLEANAFGDLLPGVLWDGMDAYAAEVAALESRQ